MVSPYKNLASKCKVLVFHWFCCFLLCNAPLFSLQCQIMMHVVLGRPLFTGCANVCLDRISSATQVSQILLKEGMEKRKFALVIEILIEFKHARKNTLTASQVYAESEFILYHKVYEAPLENVHLIWTPCWISLVRFLSFFWYNSLHSLLSLFFWADCLFHCS